MKSIESDFYKMELSPNISTDDMRSYADKVLCLALDVGENILLCGGEVNRVENTIERICRAYGAKHVEVFTINSLIVAALRMEDGSYSNQIRRMKTDGTDLYKLEKFNQISRKICSQRTPVDEALAIVKKAKHTKQYPVFLSYLGAFLGASAFTIFFGGMWIDAIIAGIIGMIIYLFDGKRPPYINKVASTVICSFIGGALSYIAIYLGLGKEVDYIIIGVVMILIPGVSFGYAIRDLLFGDVISGSMKIVQALLIAIMIALGFSISIILMGGVGTWF